MTERDYGEPDPSICPECGAQKMLYGCKAKRCRGDDCDPDAERDRRNDDDAC